MNMDYWYDDQIRRYLLQLVRLFSHFKVREYTATGVNYNRVPTRYGDSSRMVASILRNNSENVLNSAPMITVSMDSIDIDRSRSQDPFLQDTRQVAERAFDTNTGQYTSEQGNLYTIQRYMPVPYKMTIKVDIWTTNTDTKLQLLEQIMVLFNPSIQLQSNDNPLDWSNVFEVELTNINWSSRSIPQGVDETIDIATLAFEVPIWISPPAKVKRQSIIQTIIADIYSTDSVAGLGYDEAYADFFANINDTARVIVTPNDLHVLVTGASAQLVTAAGEPQNWSDIIEMQGMLSATSLLKLNTTNDIENEMGMVVGSVTANPLDPTQLIFNLDTDTLPANTLTDVNRIIDPRASSPGTGLPVAGLGQRYLITEDLSLDYTDWNIVASKGDIIQYNGTVWTVAFNSASASSPQYVTNSYTSKQYKWTGAEWISSSEGEYNPGFFRLEL